MTEEKTEWVLDLPLSKSGSSLAVIVPKRVLNELGLGSGSKVRVILRKKEE